MQPITEIKELNEKLQQKAETLKTKGTEALNEAREGVRKGGERLNGGLERLRKLVDWEKLNADNLKAAAREAAQAFAGRFRPASTAATTEAPESPKAA